MTIHHKTPNEIKKRHPKNHTHIENLKFNKDHENQGTLEFSFPISLFVIPIISL